MKKSKTKKTQNRNHSSEKQKKTAIFQKGSLLLKPLLFLFVIIGLLSIPVIKMQRAKGIAIPTPATAIIYGDSILWESSASIKSQFAKKPGWTYIQRSYPGVAVCDWQKQLVSDLATYHPSIVTIEFQGNTYTACMKNSSGNLMVFGSTEWLNKYRTDLNNFFSTATKAGAKVVYVSPLPMNNSVVNENVGTDINYNAAVNYLMNMAKVEAAKYHRVSYTHYPRFVVTNEGVFTSTLPCLAEETAAMGCNQANHRIAVRSQDGVHLCPVKRTSKAFLSPCPVYSSGETRWGRALVDQTVSPPAPLKP